MSKGMKIESWKIDKLQPYAGNPRKISEDAVEAVAESIQLFGWQQPIVVDADGVIIVGHTRRLAALKLGLAEVPVHVADISKDKADEYRLVDNKSGEFSQWDNEALMMELREMETEIVDKYFPNVDLEIAQLDEMNSMTEDEIEEATKRVSQIKELSEDKLETTRVECPACAKKFEVRTNSLLVVPED